MEKVLIAAGSAKSAESFARLLRDLGYPETRVSKTGGEARRILEEENFALVLILCPLPDEFGTETAKAAVRTPAGVMMIVRDEAAAGLSAQVRELGIFVFSPVMGRRVFEQGTNLLYSVHRRLQMAAPRTERLQEKMEDLRLIGRAKCLLIQYSHMTEQEAHRWIEQRSMDQRVTRRRVAEEILQKYEI